MGTVDGGLKIPALSFAIVVSYPLPRIQILFSSEIRLSSDNAKFYVGGREGRIFHLQKMFSSVFDFFSIFNFKIS